MALSHHELSTASVLKLCSFVFWGWSYILSTNSSPNKSPEWHSRMMTLVHGSVATIVGVHQCGMTSVDRCRFTMKISPPEYALMLWSWGYFAFDLLWCLMYQSNSYVILVHHLSALVAVNIYMNKDYAGCTFACTLALMEITNPFLQTRWLLRYEGYGQTLLFYLVEIIYFVMFLTIRAVFCTYLMFEMLTSDFHDTDEKIISLSLYLVSLALVYEILSYVNYKCKHKITSISPVLAPVCFGCTAVIASCLLVLTPETRDLPLMDTIDQVARSVKIAKTNKENKSKKNITESFEDCRRGQVF